MLAALEGLDFKARYVMEGFLSGLHDSPFHGFSVEFSDYRNYQPGDDLRHFDWRLYARNDRLCIKRYMQETNVRFYVVCDTSASMNYRGSQAWGSKLECAKVLGAALTWFLLKQNDAAGMVTLSGEAAVPEFIRPSQRPNQFGLVLRQLELLRAAGGACLSKLLQHTIRLVHRRSVILFFSDLLEPSEEVALGFKQLRFHGHEVIIFQVLDHDEIEFHSPSRGYLRTWKPAFAAPSSLLSRARNTWPASTRSWRRTASCFEAWKCRIASCAPMTTPGTHWPCSWPNENASNSSLPFKVRGSRFRVLFLDILSGFADGERERVRVRGECV